MKPRNQFDLTIEDYMGHTWILGATGAGKTNTLLYMLRHLLEPENQKKFPTAVVLVDPHGYASMEFARMIRPLGRVIILDPTYVTFSINPLALPKDFGNRVEIVKDRVGFLSSVITDVLNTDPTNAPRLMWIFKGALHFLYSFGDNPTFRDLYLFMGEMYAQGRKDRAELRAKLKNRGIPDEIVQKTIEAIAELEQNAFSPIMNRISNFVLPGNSITTRTFCSRETTIDWSEIRKPGIVTIFRLPRALIPDEDFRKLIMSLVIMNIFSEALKQAREFEHASRPAPEMTNMVLAMDEFQWVSKLSTISTILSEARKFKLFLYMAHQNLDLLDKSLLSTLSGNVGMIVSHRMGSEDARYVAKLLDPVRAEQVAKEIIGIAGHDTRLRKNPIYSSEVRSLACTFPKADEEYPFAYTEEQVKQYMGGIMESRFGGAHEAKDLIYKTAGENTANYPWWTPSQWYVMVRPYLDPIGYSKLEYNRLTSEFYRKYKWDSTTIYNALEDLTRMRYFKKSFGDYDYVFRGKDDNDVPVGKRVRPKNMDDLERRRATVYTTTEAHAEFFIDFFTPKSQRAGGPIHLAVLKKIVVEKWMEDAFCWIDLGKEGGKRPDITVLLPTVKETPDKKMAGAIIRYSSTDDWDYRNAERIEIEENPSKDPGHVFENYLKNQEFVKSGIGINKPVRFVVTMQEHVEVVRTILTKLHGVEESKYTIECVPFQSLNDANSKSPIALPAFTGENPQNVQRGMLGSSAKQDKEETGTREPNSIVEPTTLQDAEPPANLAEFFQMIEKKEEDVERGTQPPAELSAVEESGSEADTKPLAPVNCNAEPVSRLNQPQKRAVEPKPQKVEMISEQTVEKTPSQQEIQQQTADVETPVVATESPAVKKTASQLTLGIDAESSPGEPTQKESVAQKTTSSQTKKTKGEQKLDSIKTILLYLHKEGYPGRENLAEVVGVSTKTVDRYLEEMEARGLVTKTGRSSFAMSELASKAVEEAEKKKKLQA